MKPRRRRRRSCRRRRRRRHRRWPSKDERREHEHERESSLRASPRASSSSSLRAPQRPLPGLENALARALPEQPWRVVDSVDALIADDVEDDEGKPSQLPPLSHEQARRLLGPLLEQRYEGEGEKEEEGIAPSRWVEGMTGPKPSNFFASLAPHNQRRRRSGEDGVAFRRSSDFVVDGLLGAAVREMTFFSVVGYRFSSAGGTTERSCDVMTFWEEGMKTTTRRGSSPTCLRPRRSDRRASEGRRRREQRGRGVPLRVVRGEETCFLFVCLFSFVFFVLFSCFGERREERERKEKRGERKKNASHFFCDKAKRKERKRRRRKKLARVFFFRFFSFFSSQNGQVRPSHHRLLSRRALVSGFKEKARERKRKEKKRERKRHLDDRAWKKKVFSLRPLRCSFSFREARF